MKLERYEINQRPGQISVTLNQKKNALVNMVFSLGISAFALYQLLTSTDPSSFFYVLLGIGVLWLVVAIASFRQKRSYSLTDRRIEYHSSGRSKPRTISASDLSHVLLQKIVRPTGGKKRKTPLPWKVKLINNTGTEFKGEFKFQKEEPAQKLAALIAEFYGKEILKEEK